MDYPYKKIWNLIYYDDQQLGPQLCIPSLLEGEVFQKVHDDLGHPEYTRTHEQLTGMFYFHNLMKSLHSYLHHYHTCQMNQTPCHQPYGSLQPILTPPQPFYTLTINFFEGLPISKLEKFDCVMSVTNKFSKAIAFVPGFFASGGKAWATRLLNQLSLLNWGLPQILISD